MPKRYIRRGLLAIAAAVLLAVAAAFVLPYLAASRLVHERVAEELSQFTGYSVTLGAPPQVDVWPRFQAILTDVRFDDRDTGAPVAAAERMEVTLSATAALWGDAVFTAMRVERAVLYTEQEQGLLPEPAAAGRIGSAVDTTKREFEAQSEGAPDPALPREAFGTVTITQGRIVRRDPGGDHVLLSDVEAQLEWPQFDAPGRLVANALWRDDPVSLDLRSSSPLKLLAGAAAPLVFNAKSSKGAMFFDGTVRTGPMGYVDGRTSISAPKLGVLAQRLGIALPERVNAGSGRLDGTVSGDWRRLKLDNADFEIDGSVGRGALSLMLDGAVPKLGGTLAFDSLDIDAALAALAPFTTPVGDGEQARVFALDLRASATRARSGSVELTDVAASAQVTDALAAFDISDATAFGGTVQAGLRFDRDADSETIELRLLAADVDGTALGNAFGLTRMMPAARGTVSVILKGPGMTVAQMLGSAGGSVTASFGPGTLSGIDLDAFMTRQERGGFFPLADVAQGTLATRSLDIKATITDGIANVERLEARLDQRRVSLTGIVPYVGRGLALSGRVEAADAEAAKPQAEFFVGGSWDAPFITPVPVRPTFD